VDQAKRHLLQWVAAQSKGPWTRGKRGGFRARIVLPPQVRDIEREWAAACDDRHFKVF
jgi:hypothetical protein